MTKTKKFLAILFTVFSLLVVAKTVIVSPPNYAYAVVLKQGSKGADVKKMQQKLKNWGYYKGSVDGIFGAKTKEAVKYFQRRNGLVADGIVGKKNALCTWYEYKFK